MSPDEIKKLLRGIADDLIQKVNWHRQNHNDPYNIGNSAIVILTEVSKSLAKAADTIP